MKIEASERLLATQERPPVLNLQIQCDTEEAYLTLVNMLAAIQWCGGVGHSAVVGAFFDGDGSDKVRIEGLPDNSGAEMADACSAYGDGLMAMIGPHSATAYNDVYGESGMPSGYKRECVFKDGKSLIASIQAVAADPGVGSVQTDQWFSPNETNQAHDSELLYDPQLQSKVHASTCICADCLFQAEDYQLDQQEKMETAPAVLNGHER